MGVGVDLGGVRFGGLGVGAAVRSGRGGGGVGVGVGVRTGFGVGDGVLFNAIAFSSLSGGDGGGVVIDVGSSGSTIFGAGGFCGSGAALLSRGRCVPRSPAGNESTTLTV
jgi:hypothetical protein